MGSTLLPDAIRAWFAVEPDPQFCSEPGRPALFLNKHRPVEVDEDSDEDEESQQRDKLKQSVKEAKHAEKRAKRKDEEESRYLVAKLFPPDEPPPVLKHSVQDPYARPVRSSTSKGGGLVSDVAKHVAEDYLNDKIANAKALLKRLRAVRVELAEHLRKTASGVHTSSGSEKIRLEAEGRAIKFELNKIAKSMKLQNGQSIEYEPGTINVLLIAFVGDIMYKNVDVTSEFAQLVRNGGIKRMKLDVKKSLGVDLHFVDDDSLTVIFMGKADLQQTSISKHHTGLTWTPKFKPGGGRRQSALEQDLEIGDIPRPGRLTENDIVLRDMFNGYETEEPVSHFPPFMTGKLTDLELEFVKYEAGGVMCCQRPPPATVALFIA